MARVELAQVEAWWQRRGTEDRARGIAQADGGQKRVLTGSRILNRRAGLAGKRSDNDFVKKR
ncbi:MAG TPA: hypothetical protein VJY33_15720, partial [Isosphaeraceae bacterium]|nr:hypothetical protein [Isosphaeraceae bacterium]